MRTLIAKRFVPGLIVVGSAIALVGCVDSQAESPTAQAEAASSSSASAPAENVAETLPGRRDTGRIPATVNADLPGATSRPNRQAAINTSDPLPVLMVRTEPEVLDLGTVATNGKPSGTVRLVNTGDRTFKILSCKTNCGCTTANCPQGKELAPGESTEVEVTLTAGSRASRIQKYVTFNIEDHAPVRLSVKANVVSYITVTPRQLDKNRQADGKVVIASTDGQAFRIKSVDPPVIDKLPEEAATSHELFVSWDLWDQVGSGYRQLAFELDHPNANKASLLVRGVVSNFQAERKKIIGSGVPDDDSQRLDIPPSPMDQLAIAIRGGDSAAIQRALKNVPGQADRDATLILASRRGYIDGMKALIEAGADINAAGPHGRTPLMNAARSHNVDAVKLLVERGADVNTRDTVKGTALSWAAGPFGDAKMVDALLASGAEVNISDNNGMTPLIWAARFGDARRVKDLIGAGADPNVKDKQGKTALDYAMSRAEGTGNNIVDVLKPLVGRAESAESAG